MTSDRRSLLGWMVGSLASSAQAQTQKPTLRFALITPRDPARVVAAWTPLLQHLGRRLGTSISPLAVGETNELVDGFAAGRIDLAWAGNAASLVVVESGQGEVFAQMKTTDGRVAYQSVLLTHRNSPLASMDDVYRDAARLIYGDGEPASTSGHLVPLYYAFVRKGFADPHRLFKAVRVGNHSTNLLRASRREVDLAATNDVELDLLRRADAKTAESLKVLWRSPPIPQSPLLWRTALPVATRRAIQQAVLELGVDAPEERIALRNANDLGGFIRASNRQLINVADLEMFAAWRKVDADTALNAAQKRARIASITTRASKLEVVLKRPPDAWREGPP